MNKLECLSLLSSDLWDQSFKGINASSGMLKIRLKALDKDNHSSKFAKNIICDKKFYNIVTRASVGWIMVI